MPPFIRPLFVVFLIWSFLVETTLSQNCAIPLLVNLAEDSSRTECAPAGTILAELKTKNIQNLTNVRDNHLLPEYLDIILLEDQVILKVKTPLCERKQPLLDNSSFIDLPITYVDSSWNANAEIEAEFMCMDGRAKVVKFVIPLIDENTQSPMFEHPIYDVVSELCVTGTHQGYCPLNFEFPIFVTDRDRDYENAVSMFYTDLGDLINVTGGSVESNAIETQFDRSLNIHRISVHLYLKEGQKQFELGHNFTFNLIVYNTFNSPTGQKLAGQTSVRIAFGIGTPPDDCVELKKPMFLSPVFHSTVVNTNNSMQGKLLTNIEPKGVVAVFESSVKSAQINSEAADSSLQIRYSMQGNNIFGIDNVNGSVYFLAEIDRSFWETIQIFEISAYVESYSFLTSSAPLVVYFKDEDQMSCPSLPTLEPPTTCPDCSVTCPSLNMTCPTFPGTSPGWSTTEAISTTVHVPEFTTEDGKYTSIFPTQPTTSETGSDIPFPTTDLSASPETSTSTAPSTTVTPTSTTSTPTPSTTTSTSTTKPPITSPTSNPTTRSPSTTRPTTSPTTTRPTTSPTTTRPTTSPTTTRPTTSPTTTPSTTTKSPTTEAPTPPTTTKAPSTTTSTTYRTTSTTTLSTTTPRPQCCEQCFNSEFVCPVDSSDSDKKYPDPRNCSMYHQCLPDGLGGVYMEDFTCPPRLIFCKSSQLCEYADQCKCDDIEDEVCKNIDCDTECGSCYPSGHPENICTAEGLFADPVYYDIFHNCRRAEAWNPYGFIDCPERCPASLVWCQSDQRCGWESDCSKDGKLKSRCYNCLTSRYEIFL